EGSSTEHRSPRAERNRDVVPQGNCNSLRVLLGHRIPPSPERTPRNDCVVQATVNRPTVTPASCFDVLVLASIRVVFPRSRGLPAFPNDALRLPRRHKRVLS